MNHAEAFKSQGNELYKARKFVEAVAAYDEAIKAFPYDLTYYNNKAAALLEDGKFEECVGTLRHAVDMKWEISSNHKEGVSYEKLSKTFCRMAAALLKLERFDEAIEAYHKALTEVNDKSTRNLLREAESTRDKTAKEKYIDPVKAEEHKEKGNTLFKAQKYAEAKYEYDESIKRNPSDAKLYSNRAATLMKLGAYPDALKDLEESLKLDPLFVRAHARKGQVLFQLKDYNKALAAYEAGLKLDAHNADCLNGKQTVIAKISSSAGDDQADPEQVNRAMQDPEIQGILRDPQIQLILKLLQEDPKKAMDSLKDPKVATAIQKLVAAGILKMR